MGMKLIEKIRAKTGFTNYRIAMHLRESLEVRITTQGIDAYERPEAQSMRLQVLAGLRKMSGMSWSAFGEILDEEFLPKKSKSDQ